MPSPRVTAAALLVVVAATTAVHAAPDPAAPCAAVKLEASGQALARLIHCEVGSATRQDPAAKRACRARADRRRHRAFAAAETAGGCLLTGDESAAATAVTGFLDDVRTRVSASGRLSRCARRALLATCTRTRALLGATANDLVTQDPAELAAARTAAQARFEQDIEKALAKRHCARDLDPRTLAATGDAFVETLRTRLLPPLRALAAATGHRIGAAVQSGYLANEPDYDATLSREFNAVTAEFEALWIVLHPAPGVYDFTALDAIAYFAKTHGMLLRAHHLIWDMFYADYLNALTPEELRVEFEDHIRTVAGRYRGRVATWVVVNEAANLFDAGYRPGLWVDKLGPGYIADAFRIAHEADPDAELIYNDVFAEEIGPKSDFIYAMVQDLLAKGVPIHGVGFQMHQFFGAPLPETLQANLQRFEDLGLRVQLTEMDVLTDRFPGDLEARLEQQRSIYHDAVAACLAVSGCEAVTFWGFTDKHSWIDTFFGPNRYPLPFDADYRPKPAYFGVRDALLGR